MIAELANESSPSMVAILPEAVPCAYGEIFLANEEQQWVVIAPYGRWAHSQGLQIFESEDAAEIVRQFRLVANESEAIRRLGLPWYIGHPDHPAFKDRYKDGRAYGRIKDMRPGRDGLEGLVRFNAAGRQIIANEEFHGHSPNWSARRDVTTGAWRPFRLKSVGFTNEPNLPVPPILFANEGDPSGVSGADNPTQPHEMKKIIALLRSGGFTALKDDAQEDDVVRAVQQLANQKQELEGKVQTMETQATGLQAQLDAANEKVTTAEARATDTETALANERKARAAVMTDFLIAINKVPAAKRDDTITELANCKEESALQAKFTQMANAAPVLPMGNQTGNLGERKPEGSGEASASLRIQELVNERMATNGKDYDEAWSYVQRKHGDLFAKMKKPGKASA